MTELATDGGTTVEASFEPGDRVTDADENEDERAAMRVLRRTDDRADEHEIDALPGSPTVAAVNPEYPASDAVLVIAFESALARRVPDWDDTAPEDLETRFEREGGTLYSYPKSRLNPVSEDWEPPAADGRTSGEREREEVFGNHDEAVEAFIGDARRLFTAPAKTADDLGELLSVGPPASETVANADAVLADMATPPLREAMVTPRTTGVSQPTRGKCRYTRNDKYQPEDGNAIVCWHCSHHSGRRPEKFSRDDQAGAECEQQTAPAWTLRQHVAESVDLSRLPTPLAEAYTDSPRQLLDNLAALRSGDEDRIRKKALRLAYKPHLEAVEEYNYNRALALLRDRGVVAELPIIGTGSQEVKP